MVNIGDNAPAVKLKLTDKDRINEEFDLADAYKQGKTVLYFFPAAFTGVCTESACQLRNDLDEFAKLDAHIYSVSVDMPFTHKKFVELNDLNYPVLSDFNKEAINAFDIVDNSFAGFRGVSKRSLFLIDDGIIKYKWVAESPGNFPPFDELKKVLES